MPLWFGSASNGSNNAHSSNSITCFYPICQSLSFKIFPSLTPVEDVTTGPRHVFHAYTNQSAIAVLSNIECAKLLLSLCSDQAKIEGPHRWLRCAFSSRWRLFHNFSLWSARFQHILVCSLLTLVYAFYRSVPHGPSLARFVVLRALLNLKRQALKLDALSSIQVPSKM